MRPSDIPLAIRILATMTLKTMQMLSYCKMKNLFYARYALSISANLQTQKIVFIINLCPILRRVNMLKKLNSIAIIFFIASFFIANNSIAQPKGFVYLRNIDPTILQDLRYATYANLIGRPMAGYNSSQCIVTRSVALALAKLQHKLKQYNLGLKVYDCYRPLSAVKEFMAWSINPYNQRMQDDFYPKVVKTDLIKTGYMSYPSSHTRGGSVDVTLVYLPIPPQKSATEVSMGTNYGYLDEDSQPLKTAEVPDYAQKNRLYLRKSMESVGFKPTDKVWWHFTMRNEQYPNKYFDFKVR